MNKITPVVGRKVWYRPSRNDMVGPVPMTIAGSIEAGNDQPLDATVIAVWSDICVNVRVCDANGTTFVKRSVQLLQPGEEPFRNAEGVRAGGYVEWPAHVQTQTRQAATEVKRE